MKNVISLLLTCFISLVATSSYAATVNGSLTVFGVYDNVTSNTVTLSTVWASTATGDVFGTVDSSTPVGTGGVTASLDSFSAVSDFFVVGGWTLDLTSLVVDTPNIILNLSGAGVLTGHGFDATEATWTFSADSATSYSMVATAAGIPAVPVPAAIWLFGSGLIGLIGVVRRKV